MRRGEVWWATLSQPQGDRPVLLLTRDRAIERRSRVTVAIVTGRIRELPVEVLVGRDDGLLKQSAVNLDELFTIPKADLNNLITELSPQKMAEVEAAIKFALALR